MGKPKKYGQVMSCTHAGFSCTVELSDVKPNSEDAISYKNRYPFLIERKEPRIQIYDALFGINKQIAH